MKNQPTTSKPSALPRLFRATLIAGLLPAIFLLSTKPSEAGSKRFSVANTAPAPSWLANISTRGFVQTDDNVLIGGFVIEGTEPKTVIVRAIGPELGPRGVTDFLTDPTLELHDATQVIATNDNWQTTQIGGIITTDQVSDIQNSGFVPSEATESAIVATLQPGLYSAIVRGQNRTTGVALVEVFDLSPSSASILANISTRSFVQTDDNVMIGGFVIEGTQPKRVIVRAIGPELGPRGVTDFLADPTLELHDATQMIASNDNWQTTQVGGIITADQVTDIQNSGFLPSEATESAIIATLQPGLYSAIVRGQNRTTGVALVEVFDLEPTTGLLAGSVDYTGPYPVPGAESYTDNGQTVNVRAFGGQVLVFFDTPISDTDAQNLINANGGVVIGKFPQVGYYLVNVTAGTEGAFISTIEVDRRVYLAVPHGVGYLAATILDGCAVSHSESVKDALIAEGGTFDGCWNIITGNTNESDVSENQVASGIITETSNNSGGTTLLNLSAGGGLNGKDYTIQTVDVQQSADAEWKLFMRVYLASVASMPAAYRENLVITIAAGNGNMPIDHLLADLRQDPKIADVLTNNVLIVTSNQFVLANDTSGDPDVAIMTNPLSIDGTSLAAPAALAYIQNIMAATGASARIALQAVKEAVNDNADHQLILSEAIDKAMAILNPPLSVSPVLSDAGSIGGCPGGSVEIPISVTAPANVTWKAYPDQSDTQYALGGGSGAGSGSFNINITKPPDTPTYGATCSDIAQFTWYDVYEVFFYATDGSLLETRSVQVKWVELLVL